MECDRKSITIERAEGYAVRGAQPGRCEGSARVSAVQDTTGWKNAACECANLKQQIQNKPAHSSCPPQLSPLFTIRTLVVSAAGTSRLLGQAGPEGPHCCGSLGGASIECSVGKRDCSLLRVAISAPDVPLDCNSIAMANATVLPPTATDCSTVPALYRTKVRIVQCQSGAVRNAKTNPLHGRCVSVRVVLLVRYTWRCSCCFCCDRPDRSSKSKPFSIALFRSSRPMSMPRFVARAPRYNFHTRRTDASATLCCSGTTKKYYETNALASVTGTA